MIFLIDVNFVYPEHFTSAAVYVVRLHTHSQNILNWDGPIRVQGLRECVNYPHRLTEWCLTQTSGLLECGAGLPKTHRVFFAK